MSREGELACAGCGSAELTRWGPAPDIPPANAVALAGSVDPATVRGELYRCSTCGLGFRSPALTAEQLREVYSAMPSGQMVYPFETNGAWVEARSFLLGRWSADDEPEILDVGCNEGLFLAGLPASWRKFGVESSREASLKAREGGVEIIGGFLGDGDETFRARFDVVCMFDVFEHLPSPQAGLQAALRYLKPGGILMLSTANIDRWNWRWLGPSNWYLEIPIHVSLASRKFVEWFASAHHTEVLHLAAVPHRRGRANEVIDEAVAVLYTGFRRRGGLFRIPQIAIHSIPRWRNLMHKTTAPFTPHLRDHLVAFLQSTAIEGCSS